MPDTTTGALLVVHGDLTKLACHAVVVPTSADLQVTPPWRDLVPIDPSRPAPSDWLSVALPAPEGWGVTERTLRAPDVGKRQVWLVQTDGWDGSADWLVDGLEQAVRRAAAAVGSVSDRSVPLIGVPLAGAGAGGFAHRRGDLVEKVIGRLSAVAADVGVDVALVLWDRQDFVAVQAARRDPCSALIGPELTAQADRLGGLAATGELVLFLGAGVSVGAGLPGWRGLLAAMQQSSSLRGMDLDGLTAPEAAQVLYDEMRDGFVDFMRSTFTLERCSLTHALLAGLQAESVVTTNYDNGYELAAAPVQPSEHRLRVLPREHAEPGAPWLLKMHGDVAAPDSIVLTKDHYLDYADTRAPLTGMVQALLMTRHVLFVGFSLTDDNFSRLAHQVRRVLKSGGTSPRKVGTVLALEAQPARERLWREDLDHVSLAASGTPDQYRLLASARCLELLLDRVAWRACVERSGSDAFLLDTRYDGVTRPPAETELRDRLRSFLGDLGPVHRETSAWRVVEEAVTRLGGGARAADPERH